MATLFEELLSGFRTERRAPTYNANWKKQYQSDEAIADNIAAGNAQLASTPGQINQYGFPQDSLRTPPLSVDDSGMLAPVAQPVTPTAPVQAPVAATTTAQPQNGVRTYGDPNGKGGTITRNPGTGTRNFEDSFFGQIRPGETYDSGSGLTYGTISGNLTGNPRAGMRLTNTGPTRVSSQDTSPLPPMFTNTAPSYGNYDGLRLAAGVDRNIQGRKSAFVGNMGST